jgi:hypothetical protein
MRRLAITTVVLMAAVTACGGSSSNSSGGTTKSTTSHHTASAPMSVTPSSGASSGNSGGSDPGSSYCTALKSAKDKFKSLDVTGLSDGKFQQVTAEFDALAAAAPSSVKADWATVSGALKKLYQILSNAGLSFNDLQSLSSGHLPKGVTAQQMSRIGKQLEKDMTGSGFQAAATRITAQAKAECGVNMGG